MDNFLVPHTKSSVNPSSMYKYHDFVRTRQQLHFDESTHQAKGSDQQLNKQRAGGAMVDAHANSEKINPSTQQAQQHFFVNQPSQSQQLNQARILNNKGQYSGAPQKTHSLSSKHHPHHHSNSVKSPKVNGSQNIAKHTNLLPQSDETHQSLELVAGASTQATSTGQPITMQSTNQNRQSNGVVLDAANQQQQTMKLISRSHLTSANHQMSQKQEVFKQGTKQVQQQQLAQDGTVGAENQFAQWQITSHSHPSQASRSGMQIMGPSNNNSSNHKTHGASVRAKELAVGGSSNGQNPITHNNNLNVIEGGNQPSITFSDSKSDKINGSRIHQHQGRIVKINQGQIKDQHSSFGKPHQSPNQLQKGAGVGVVGQRLAMDSSGVSRDHQSDNFHQNQQTGHPVYQTIAKIGEAHLLNGNLSKIKNQFVQKSGHLMGQGYNMKEIDRQQNNFSGAYTHDNYQHGSSKHRDVSNYSNNSQYAQLSNKVGGQLKQTPSGIMMQQQPQQVNNAGIPVFIQRNQQWHGMNPGSFNNLSGNGGGSGSLGERSSNGGGPPNGIANSATGDAYLIGQKQGNHSVFLPQISQQKEHQSMSMASNHSMIESQRPAPLQTNGKKMNVDQHSREFPEYYNYQPDLSPNILDSSTSGAGPHKVGQVVQIGGSGGVGAAVSASASFKKSTDSTGNNYHQDLKQIHKMQSNRNNSGRTNVPVTGNSVGMVSGATHTWQTASTSRKQKSNKVISVVDSGNGHHLNTGKPNPFDQSGAYELNSVGLSKKPNNNNSIYQMAIKSAASTVGSVNRVDPNQLQLLNKDETLKMHHTGDLTKGQNGAISITNNKEALNISNNLQRSMNFRRKQSKEVRATSAKWNNGSGNGQGTAVTAAINNHSSVGKTYGTKTGGGANVTISHKSPHNKQQHLQRQPGAQQQNIESDWQIHKDETLVSSQNSPEKDSKKVLTRKKHGIATDDNDFKLSLKNQNKQFSSLEHNTSSGGNAAPHVVASTDKLALQEELKQSEYGQQSSPKRHRSPPHIPVGFQFQYDLGDEPEEEDDEVNNTDGEEEGEEEQDDILIVEGDDVDLDHDEDEDIDRRTMRGQTQNQKGRAISNCALKDQQQEQKVRLVGLSPTNKSLNASQEEVSTQLYGGDIYLMGGSHFLMKDVDKQGDDSGTNGAVKSSQASTDTGSGVPQKSGTLNRQISQLKKRGTGKSRKRTHTKGNKQLQKIQERNSIQECEEEETQVGVQQTDNRSVADQEVVNQTTSSKKLQGVGQSQALVPINGQLTDKQRKNALRDEFLKRAPNQIITMVKSPFVGRDPYIFFPYPPFLGQQRDLPRDYNRIVQYTQDQLKPYCTPGFKVSDSTHTYNCVVNALKMAGFRHVTGAAWNVVWTGLFRQGRLRNMNNQQHINHFAGSWAIGRKDYMWRNVQRMRRLHGKAFDIAPPTYIFPEDYKRWMIDRETNNFKNMYILKPNAASCGKGIRVIGKKQNVNKRAGYIVSKYVSKPHLIKGYKYDLRLYVLVTSFDPIKIYLFRDGLVRLATVPYSTSKASLKQRFVHLTNYSVNKKADSYVKNTNSPTKIKPNDGSEDDQEGKAEEETVESKLSLQQLRKEFQQMGIDYNEVFGRIKDLIIKTCFSAEAPILQCIGGNKNKNACFEIYGFDVLIDAKLRPWLLEVNVSPSLSSSSPLDKQIKTMLLSDTLYLVGFRLIDRKQQELEKNKQNKQRLLGFESQKKKQGEFVVVKENEQVKSLEDQTSSAGKEPTKSGASRSRQPISSNNGMQVKNSGFNSFISNDSPLKSDVDSAGLPYQHLQGISSATKSSSPNRKRATFARMQPPKPWLKDMGEPALTKTPSANAGQASQSLIQPMEGYVNLTEVDLEMLADYEEEQQRKGHFELLFPTPKNIETYRPFLSSNRRANLLLWAYLRQGAPTQYLINHFKYMQLQSQLLLQQQANASASTSM